MPANRNLFPTLELSSSSSSDSGYAASSDQEPDEVLSMPSAEAGAYPSNPTTDDGASLDTFESLTVPSSWRSPEGGAAGAGTAASAPTSPSGPATVTCSSVAGYYNSDGYTAASPFSPGVDFHGAPEGAFSGDPAAESPANFETPVYSSTAPTGPLSQVDPDYEATVADEVKPLPPGASLPASVRTAEDLPATVDPISGASSSSSAGASSSSTSDNSAPSTSDLVGPEASHEDASGDSDALRAADAVATQHALAAARAAAEAARAARAQRAAGIPIAAEVVDLTHEAAASVPAGAPVVDLTDEAPPAPSVGTVVDLTYSSPPALEPGDDTFDFMAGMSSPSVEGVSNSAGASSGSVSDGAAPTSPEWIQPVSRAVHGLAVPLVANPDPQPPENEPNSPRRGAKVGGPTSMSERLRERTKAHSSPEGGVGKLEHRSSTRSPRRVFAGAGAGAGSSAAGSRSPGGRTAHQRLRAELQRALAPVSMTRLR